MEADLDKSEIMRPKSGELHGNRLLHSHYAGSISASPKKRKVCIHGHDENTSCII